MIFPHCNYLPYQNERRSMIYNIIEKGRTKDYNNLSFSVNFLPGIGQTNAKAFSLFVFSVTNILGFNNIYNYNFSVNGQNKVAVVPPSKRFIYLRYFVSLGIDRTHDDINNHL